MTNKTASCRVCGKQFIPCNKSSAEIGAFNYREVACSQECGQEYLKRVLAARNPVKTEPIAAKSISTELMMVESTEILQENKVSEDTEK